MPSPSTLLLFFGASFVLLVVPGPSVTFIVARSLEHGRTAGLVSVLGVHAGSVVHVAAAAVGVSALLASSASAFAVVKYLGAAYLVYLGLAKLRNAGRHATPSPARARRSRLFWQGFVVNVLNPKTALFFLAFLPNFVEPARGPVAPQVLVLGMCFIGLGLVSDGAYAFAAGTLGDRLRESPAVRRWVDRFSGGIYLGLGALTAFSGHRARSS
jgi:threonine/homoserine/homoserine lactone efflux protein